MSEIHQDAEGNIVVTRLRSMSQRPYQYSFVQVAFKDHYDLYVCLVTRDGWKVMVDGEFQYISPSLLSGWVYLPIYKPEK